MKKIILGFYLAGMYHKHKPALAVAAFKLLDKYQPESLREVAARITQDYGSINQWAEQARGRSALNKIVTILNKHAGE